MRVSIVTICYNHADFLEEAMLSVLDQQGVDLEYIVVDDGSTDGSRNLMEKYRHRLAHLIFQPNQGPAAALNKGFSKATGEIFGYLNSDDAFLPDALAKAARVLASDPQLDVVNAHAYLVDRDGARIHKVFSHRFDAEAYAMGCCVVIQPSTFFRPRLFRAVGGFNNANRLDWDGELMLDFSLAGARFRVIPDYWSKYRIYPESITGSRADKRSQFLIHSQRFLAKAGAEFSQSRKQYLRLKNWLRQPVTLALRIADGIRHPVRVI